MLNHGKTDTATVINMSKGKIFIYPTMIMSGIISVRDNDGNVLWQKANCMADDISFAIEICNRGIQTGVFETD